MIENFRCWAEINLDNLTDNFSSVKELTKTSTKIMSSVKADAYGHGCVQCAKKLVEAGTDYLAVATTDEARLLIKNKIKVPILILGYAFGENMEELIEHDIRFSVTDFEFAEFLSKTAQSIGKKAKIHIKIDVGMGRFGFLYGYSKECNIKTISDIEKISTLDGIEIEGIFTHFPNADDKDETLTKEQFGKFLSVIKELSIKGIEFKLRHCCNSAATMRFPEMHLDMIRPGIVLYGYHSSKYCEIKNINFKPVMEFKSRISYIKEMPKESAVGYGGTFISDKNIKVATLTVGYADGLSRRLSNKYEMSVLGHKSKILGRICMDQCMIDVSDVNNISIGTEVVIFGNNNSIEKYCKAIGTISYEVLCSVSRRVPRVFFANGKIINVANYLN